MNELDEMKAIVLNFRVSELQVLLRYANVCKSGRKQELQSRALELLDFNPNLVRMKIFDLYRQRFANSNRGATNKFKFAHFLQPPPAHGGSVPKLSYSQIPLVCSGTCSAVAPPPPPPPPPPRRITAASLSFRKNPFFELVEELVSPSVLAPNVRSAGPAQVCKLKFLLTAEQAHVLSVARDVRLGADTYAKVHLRFCIADFTGKQETLPFGLSVEVNGATCPIPSSSSVSRPGIDLRRRNQHIDITGLCKISPLVPNKVIVAWIPEVEKTYGVTVHLVNRLTSEDLLKKVKNNSEIPSSVTKDTIMQKLKCDDDDEIVTTTMKASLICPLGKKRISVPCRSSTCSHVQCFDGKDFLQLNEKKDTFICPICDKPIRFENLLVDGLFSEILANTPPECKEVEFNEDGNWTPVVEIAKIRLQLNASSGVSHTRHPSIEVIDLTDEVGSSSPDAIFVQPPKKKKKKKRYEASELPSKATTRTISVKQSVPALPVSSSKPSPQHISSKLSPQHMSSKPSPQHISSKPSSQRVRTTAGSRTCPSVQSMSSVPTLMLPSAVRFPNSSTSLRMFVPRTTSPSHYSVMEARCPPPLPFFPYSLPYYAQALPFGSFFEGHVPGSLGLPNIYSFLPQGVYSQNFHQVYGSTSLMGHEHRVNSSTPDVISLE